MNKETKRIHNTGNKLNKGLGKNKEILFGCRIPKKILMPFLSLLILATIFGNLPINAFADEYFHSPLCPIEGCGPKADLAAIEKTVRIYAGLKTLLIESCTHHPMPEFRAVLAENILK